MADAARTPAEEYAEIERAWSREDAFESAHATSLHNPERNRYSDIHALDATRVKLRGVENDYINANYIDGPLLPGYAETATARCYISAQAPVSRTVPDFWRMIWQENITVVVMLTREIERGVVKSVTYWPTGDQELRAGPFAVTLESEEQLEHMIAVRTFCVQCDSSPSEFRTVIQIHYREWPDHGVPRDVDGMLAVLDVTNRTLMSVPASGPLLVHCSAGVGRSGTFIAIHTAARMLAHGIKPDIFAIVYNLRKQRRVMVQTRDQYLFVYRAVGQIAQRILHQPGSLQLTPYAMPDFKQDAAAAAAAAVLEPSASAAAAATAVDTSAAVVTKAGSLGIGDGPAPPDAAAATPLASDDMDS